MSVPDLGFPVGGHGPRRRGRGSPRRLPFKNFVCQNERIWTLGGHVPGTPPRSTNGCASGVPSMYMRFKMAHYKTHVYKTNTCLCIARCGMRRFPLFLNAPQGSFTMFAHSILPHGLRGMAKLAILCNPHSVPFCPPLWLALCDVK